MPWCIYPVPHFLQFLFCPTQPRLYTTTSTNVFLMSLPGKVLSPTSEFFQFALSYLQHLPEWTIQKENRSKRVQNNCFIIPAANILIVFHLYLYFASPHNGCSGLCSFLKEETASFSPHNQPRFSHLFQNSLIVITE